MIDPPAELLGLSQQWLSEAFAVFMRVGAMAALLPAFGEQMIPARVRLAAAIAFTMITMTGLDDATRAALAFRPLFPFHLFEALNGLAIGLSLRLMVMSLQMAGALIAQSISMSQILGGAGGEPQPAIGTLLTLGGLAAAMHLGLPVKLALYMIGSYAALPPGGLPPAGLFADWTIAEAGKGLSLAFGVAMPFVLASLIYNVALGAINRAMPQLMVAFIGAPALSLAGLAMLALLAPAALETWTIAFDALLSQGAGP